MHEEERRGSQAKAGLHVLRAPSDRVNVSVFFGIQTGLFGCKLRKASYVRGDACWYSNSFASVRTRRELS